MDIKTFLCSCLPPQALRFQSQACKLEARETGDERAHHFRSESEMSGNETLSMPFSTITAQVFVLSLANFYRQ